jgi:hypothetical protein
VRPPTFLIQELIQLAIFAVPAAVAIYFAVRSVGSMQRALTACAAHNREMNPGLVWLLLVPLFNLGWWFRAVIAVGRSFRSEFEERDLD